MRTGAERQARRARARLLAGPREGVVSRAELREIGADRRVVSREVAASRWAVHGRVTVATHTAALSEAALRWRAVWEAGPDAALDGVSALCAAGLRHFRTDVLHVSVPEGSRIHRVDGVRVHHPRGRLVGELLDAGPPRVRAPVAAVRAAHWAVSDRQAALVLCMTVQQRLATGEQLVAAASAVRGRARRSFVAQVVADVADGAHSLGELDFAALCRRRGLPEPDRQVVRVGPRGRVYLDVRWRRIGLVVEIDGAQHRQGLAVSDDHLRRNSLVLTDETVLGIDLVGLRLREAEFMGQVVAAHELLTARLGA
ncbi:MAG TPA: hypothetical protein VES93_07145 [Ornithinibacter sp.]|nr:hypothetical protein [Ornithinibacter sp.]